MSLEQQQHIERAVRAIVEMPSPLRARIVQPTSEEIDALNALRAAAVVPILLAVLRAPEQPDQDSRAYKALLSLEQFDRAAFLLDLFDSPPTPEWKAAICQDMGDYPDPRILARLTAIAQDDPDPDVRAFALESLVDVAVRLGTDAPLKVLEELAENATGEGYEGRPIRRIAQWAIEQLRERSAPRNALDQEGEQSSAKE
jgi:hypothetical protein